MKFSIASAFLTVFGVQLVIALPSKTDGVSLVGRDEFTGLKVDVMTWTGRINAHDEHEISVKVDDKQIWEQIVAINPDYAKEHGFEDPRTRDYTQYRPSHDITGIDGLDGRVDCHNDTREEREQMIISGACDQSHAYLDSLDHGYGMVHIPSLATVSVACFGACGIKIINKTGREWIGRARDISMDVYRVEEVCDWNPGFIPKGWRGYFHGELIFGDHSTWVHRADC